MVNFVTVMCYLKKKYITKTFKLETKQVPSKTYLCIMLILFLTMHNLVRSTLPPISSNSKNEGLLGNDEAVSALNKLVRSRK